MVGYGKCSQLVKNGRCKGGMGIWAPRYFYKTKYIIFHNRGKEINPDGLTVLFDNNDPSSPHNPDLVTPLERIKSTNEPSSRYYKLLGILFDENLNFNFQNSNLCSKLSKAIYFFNKTKNLLPPKALKSLYFAYFHSHLLYCPIINSCTSHSNVLKISKLQKSNSYCCGSQLLSPHQSSFQKP